MSKRMVRWFAAEFGLAVAISFAVAAARELRLGQKPAAPEPAVPEPAVTEPVAVAEDEVRPQLVT